MKYSKTLTFFGNEIIANATTSDAPIFRALLAAGYEIKLLVINQSIQSGRNQKGPSQVEQIAEENDIEVYYFEDSVRLAQKLKDTNSSFAVLAAFGKIVSQEVIDSFEHGIINIHPSLLPIYRGPTPIESAIINGDKQTGVSIISLETKMDAGPIYAFSELKLNGNESKQQLAQSLAEIAAEMLVQTLPGILSADLQAMQQDEEQAVYVDLIEKADGEINWKSSSSSIERKVRAHFGWPGSQAKLGDIECLIEEVTPIEETASPGKLLRLSKNSLAIGTSDKALQIKRIKPSGKQSMDAASFMAGYSSKIFN